MLCHLSKNVQSVATAWWSEERVGRWQAGIDQRMNSFLMLKIDKVSVETWVSLMAMMRQSVVNCDDGGKENGKRRLTIIIIMISLLLLLMTTIFWCLKRSSWAGHVDTFWHVVFYKCHPCFTVGCFECRIKSLRVVANLKKVKWRDLWSNQ